MNNSSAYGLWSLVIINSFVFIIFAFSFTKPRSPRYWRSFGAFSAFIVALFAEMYGIPLTIYLLSGWLQTFGGLAGFVQSTEKWQPGSDGTLCTSAPSPIRCLDPNYVGVFVAMADPLNPIDVSHLSLDVSPLGSARGAGSDREFW